VPAEALDVFRDDPTGLWREVMRRQPGELAWHSTRPVDPNLN
jgi:putative transcriptional regulator